MQNGTIDNGRIDLKVKGLPSILLFRFFDFPVDSANLLPRLTEHDVHKRMN